MAVDDPRESRRAVPGSITATPTASDSATYTPTDLSSAMFYALLITSTGLSRRAIAVMSTTRRQRLVAFGSVTPRLLSASNRNYCLALSSPEPNDPAAR